MIRIFNITFLLLLAVAGQAQEVVETGAATEGDTVWSTDVKIIVLAVFILLNIILVIRTFRNKPDA